MTTGKSFERPSERPSSLQGFDRRAHNPKVTRAYPVSRKPKGRAIFPLPELAADPWVVLRSTQ